MIALAIALSVQAAEPVIDGPPLDWVTQRAPYGMDVTLDGKLWVNTNEVGARDDYAILANDLYKAVTAHSSRPRVWIRGYHRRNPSVAYRETKTLVTIDCQRDEIWVEKRLYYSAEGEVLSAVGPLANEPIVPGSVGEAWRRAACPA